MIRFIDLTNQIYGIGLPNPPKLIAYFNTITDRFVEVGGEQVFDSYEHMLEWLDEDAWGFDLERYKKLTPKEFLK